jgi:hypothetical protein
MFDWKGLERSEKVWKGLERAKKLIKMSINRVWVVVEKD